MRSVTLLGTFPDTEGSAERRPAIVRIEKTPFLPESAARVGSGLLEKVDSIEQNDIVMTFLLLLVHG